MFVAPQDQGARSPGVGEGNFKFSRQRKPGTAMHRITGTALLPPKSRRRRHSTRRKNGLVWRFPSGPAKMLPGAPVPASIRHGRLRRSATMVLTPGRGPSCNDCPARAATILQQCRHGMSDGNQSR